MPRNMLAPQQLDMAGTTEIASLIEPQIPALRRYAFALTRNHAAADDLVQDCLERAIAHWSTRRSDGDARAWLFSILHNLFISSGRQRRRRGMHLSAEVTDLAALDEHDSALMRRDIFLCLDSLSDEHRAVLLLAGVEALPYDEIGKIIGIPAGTVMSRLSRAREKFRRLMEGELPAQSKSVSYLRSVK